MGKLISGVVAAVLAVGLSMAVAKGMLDAGDKTDPSQERSFTGAVSEKAIQPSAHSGNPRTGMAGRNHSEHISELGVYIPGTVPLLRSWRILG